MLLEKGQRQDHLIYLNSQVPEGFDVEDRSAVRGEDTLVSAQDGVPWFRVLYPPGNF